MNECQMQILLRQLPKCEHHMHLEGALTPDLLFQLAAKNRIQLPANDPAFTSIESLRERYNRFASLDDFLHYYYIGMSVLLTAEDFEAVTLDYFLHASADGVAHAELFFDPQAHLSRGVSYKAILAGINAARLRAIAKFGISSELICCFLRHLPVADCEATFELEDLQNSLMTGEVCGIGLDSSELGFPPELFQDIYQRAKGLGVKRTAHAGEEGPVSYIRSALDKIEIDRIDHGIQLVKDPELLSHVAERGTLLSVCPMSNVFLKCVDSVADLPIRAFLDAGINFSINSDDPAYFGSSYLLDNYWAVQQAFRLSVGEWKTICEASIRGSWCDARRKGELLSNLENVIQEWNSS